MQNEKCKLQNEKICSFYFELCTSIERGFSLVELLAVLSLLALASLIVLPSVDRGLRGREVRKSALELAALARDLRGRAVYESMPQRLIFSPLENSYQAWRGKRVTLSSDIKISEIKGGEPIGEGLRQFLFFPNGTTLGGEVAISAREGLPTYWVRFDALTGRIGIVQEKTQ